MGAPELVHVAEMSAALGEQFVVPNGPQGTRVIAEVDSISVTGDRLSAEMVGTSAADWLTLGPDGSYGTLDVRATLRTPDGDVIYMEYGGKIDLAAGRVASAPTFQTGAESLSWLNSTQFVGDGTLDRDTNVLTYQVYEVRLT